MKETEANQTKPYHNVSILTASFPSPTDNPALLLLPSFKYIPEAPPHKPTLAALTKAHLLPRKLHPMHDALSAEDKARLTRDPDAPGAPGAVDVKDVVVLICGHGGRDVRCGVMGPLLRGKFNEVFNSDGIPVTESPPTPEDEGGKARVGLISHIGGHKFAGNVIVYIPPEMKGQDGEKHALAGCAVWYGRVDENHVEGIVGATVRRGEIIKELFRGGIDSEGRMLEIGK